jgi:glycolate oxidase iron-sulfur subunit
VSEPSLKSLDYSVLQQCMHCGMCLPTCPTYDLTKLEKHSPRGRIALMRAIADDHLELGRDFGDEMSYCLGCLACETACPAGVDYAHLFEVARADVEKSGVMANPVRSAVRTALLKILFTHPRLLRLVGRMLWLYQATGVQWLFRRLGLTRLLPAKLRVLEPMTPVVLPRFSHQLIRPVEKPADGARYRVGLLTGCVQDLVFADINRDTADVLLVNGCEVITPPVQPCCGSIHGHNGEHAVAQSMARRMIDLFDPFAFDAIITNAAGCGSHLKNYGRLLAEDRRYAARALEWDRKLKDINEWLVEIGFRAPASAPADSLKVTYHEACHLCHGQKIGKQPREILRAVPGVELVELPESNWCCGSAGVYNITQPVTATVLQERKVDHALATGADAVATCNPGCHLQLVNGLRQAGSDMLVTQPVSLLAQAYRSEKSWNATAWADPDGREPFGHLPGHAAKSSGLAAL